MKFSNNLQWFVQTIFRYKSDVKLDLDCLRISLAKFWTKTFSVKNLVIQPIKFESYSTHKVWILVVLVGNLVVSLYIYRWSYCNVPYPTASNLSVTTQQYLAILGLALKGFRWLAWLKWNCFFMDWFCYNLVILIK